MKIPLLRTARRHELCYYFDEYVEFKREEGVSAKTISTYRRAYNLMLRYEAYAKTKLTLYSFDYEFYRGLRHYMLNVKQYKQGYFGGTVKVICNFIQYLNAHHGLDNVVYKSFRSPRPKSDEIALTSEELKRLWTLDINKHMGQIIEAIQSYEGTRLDRLQRTNRLIKFIQSYNAYYAICSSGMYPNDLYRYEKDWIGDNSIVSYNRYKNSQPCSFVYCDTDIFKFKTIAEQSGHKFSFSMKYLYRDLKIIENLMGFNKKLTPRQGRKTYATILSHEMCLDIHNIRTVLGHRDGSHATFDYVKADSELKKLRLQQAFMKSA